ncbi:hypothetical protein PILCRDRAFT_827448 [Piloderma croceum F 1598]|uniref:Uncharacterized protein n=1 Tax=Piloderma croceum (strain F 1598) TaxID=765440 RepID=A0A0C3ERL9_PILCF|nr:hypothetical protein PILCRDRAFT_827448 [Piloderma croceum F 1598]
MCGDSCSERQQANHKLTEHSMGDNQPSSVVKHGTTLQRVGDTEFRVPRLRTVQVISCRSMRCS